MTSRKTIDLEKGIGKKVFIHLGACDTRKLYLEDTDISGGAVLLSVDRNYPTDDFPSFPLNQIEKMSGTGSSIKHYRYNSDVYTFLEKMYYHVDGVFMYRFLEHVPMRDIIHFIYLVSTVLKKDGFVDIIVPDYEKLATMLLKEDIDMKDFEKHNILLTTEMLNDVGDPHLSIWTKNRLKYYWEYEERFYIEKITKGFHYDGRNVYLRALLRRI